MTDLNYVEQVEEILESEKASKNRANAKIQQGWHLKRCPMRDYLKLIERQPLTNPPIPECNCKENKS